MCGLEFIKSKGHRCGQNIWFFGEFQFDGCVMGRAYVSFMTNHREDGSVPDDGVVVSGAVVFELTVFDDDGDEMPVDSETMEWLKRQVLDEFDAEHVANTFSEISLGGL